MASLTQVEAVAALADALEALQAAADALQAVTPDDASDFAKGIASNVRTLRVGGVAGRDEILRQLA